MIQGPELVPLERGSTYWHEGLRFYQAKTLQSLAVVQVRVAPGAVAQLVGCSESGSCRLWRRAMQRARPCGHLPPKHGTCTSGCLRLAVAFPCLTNQQEAAHCILRVANPTYVAALVDDAGW